MPGRPPVIPSLATRAVHPRAPEPQPGRPVAPVIDPSSTYAFDDNESFAHASSEKVGAGYVYTRWANPTLDAFATAVADLEGAEAAEAFASGMAAISSIFLTFCRPGDRCVAARQLYGGTHSLSQGLLPNFNIETTLCEVDDYAAIDAALDGAKFLYCETIGNPAVRVADIPHLAEIARAHDVPLVVDNTFASPILCRPLEHAASLVVHSATKFIGGHHDLIGGVVCGDLETIRRIQGLTRELGPTMSPFNAFLCLRGLQTMPLRVERSCDNALAVAQALNRNDAIGGVFYPGLDTSKDHELCIRLLGGQGGGTIAFDVRGGPERATRFQDALQLVQPAASLGGTHSLIVHAASVTHTQLNERELEAAGISPGFCRMSVGIEDAADIVADLEQALIATTTV